MGLTILAVIAVIALIGTVFVLNQKENAAEEAMLARVSALEGEWNKMLQAKVTQAEFAELEDSVFGLQSRMEEITAALAKAELLANKPQTVELQQKKPFYVQLVPKNLEPTKKKPVKK
jgi:hypothetical protein